MSGQKLSARSSSARERGKVSLTQSTVPIYSSETTNFSSGARRSADAKGKRFDLVCPSGVRRVAERCYLGAVVKGYGEDNWTKGMDIQDTLNHIQQHLDLWKIGDRSDDHLGGAAWGVFALIHFSECCRCHKGRAIMKELDKLYLEVQR